MKDNFIIAYDIFTKEPSGIIKLKKPTKKNMPKDFINKWKGIIDFK